MTELDNWLLAKEIFVRDGMAINPIDSKPDLEQLGFTIQREEEQLYIVIPPPGWKMAIIPNEKKACVQDSNGTEVISQVVIFDRPLLCFL
jgi:hypothetical protein